MHNWKQLMDLLKYFGTLVHNTIIWPNKFAYIIFHFKFHVNVCFQVSLIDLLPLTLPSVTHPTITFSWKQHLMRKSKTWAPLQHQLGGLLKMKCL